VKLIGVLLNHTCTLLNGIEALNPVSNSFGNFDILKPFAELFVLCWCQWITSRSSSSKAISGQNTLL